jgi:hypothetical protein
LAAVTIGAGSDADGESVLACVCSLFTGFAELSALGLWRHPRSPDDKLASTRLWPQPLPAMISVWQQDG